jgi:hypothetical protein
MRGRWHKPDRDLHERFARNCVLPRTDGAHHNYGFTHGSQGDYRRAHMEHGYHGHDDRALDGG